MLEYVDELDFSQEKSAFFQVQGQLLKKNFEKRHIPTTLVGGVNEVYDFINQFIIDRPYIHDIAFSDGVTLYQLDLFNWVKSHFKEGFNINEPLERSKTGHYVIYGEREKGYKNIPYDEWKELSSQWYDNVRKSLLSDLLIISANAITLNGEIISIDGLGNRVSGMIFGPRHVICIVGRNKISTDIDAAMNRIHNYVAPLTYLRHINKHFSNFNDCPCVKVGKCANCNHDSSACRNVVVIRGQNNIHKDRIHLLVLDEDLGF